MGLFRKKHDNGIAEQFGQILSAGQAMTEQEFLDQLNSVTNAVVKDKSYSTNDKLKIYELLSQISNCGSSDRNRYAKKLTRLLK